MALQLSKEQPSGVTGDYWRIREVKVSPSKVECTVELYKDSAARIANKAEMEVTIYVWEGADHPCEVADMDAVNENVYSLCYDKLKTLAEFSDAVDI